MYHLTLDESLTGTIKVRDKGRAVCLLDIDRYDLFHAIRQGLIATITIVRAEVCTVKVLDKGNDQCDVGVGWVIAHLIIVNSSLIFQLGLAAPANR